MSSFFSHNLVFVFFVYGLAYFSMGLAILLESRKSSNLKLASSLPFLGGFGLLHGVVEWFEMSMFITEAKSPAQEWLAVETVGILLMALSIAFLLLFGSKLLAGTTSAKWLEWAPGLLFAAWFIAVIADLALGGSLSDRWLTNANALARYVLYLPGSVLASMALAFQIPQFVEGNMPRIARATAGAAVAFAFNAVVAGLVVPAAPFPPASALNYDSFLALTGVPVQVLRAGSAITIVYFVLKMLRVFETEHGQQLEAAHQQRFQAQQEALELSRRLYEEIQRKEHARGQLLEKTISAQEEERKRIARELHDEASQALTALIISLESAEESLPNDLVDFRERLGSIKALTIQTLEEIRKIIMDLRPTLLDDLGLIPALRWYAKSHSEISGTKFNFRADGFKERLPAQMETVLFRVVQEAITNITRHSQASTATIRLAFDESDVRASIEDDGIGFDVERTLRSRDSERGLGLLGMEERIALLGGTLSIESTPGKGTRVTLRVPVHSWELVPG
ncbi:MAG: sensor histidine kinase [Chloroflexi bacterium]|nr:sensor histidine kinase [Chloroflexota bacterium]